VPYLNAAFALLAVSGVQILLKIIHLDSSWTNSISLLILLAFKECLQDPLHIIFSSRLFTTLHPLEILRPSY